MVDSEDHPVLLEVALQPWSASGIALLRRCNVPEMMLHLGGPESDEALIARNEKYLALWKTGEARMFQVLADGAPDPVAMVGYWDSIWREIPIYEMGWSIAPEHQGKGYATRAIVAVRVNALQSGAPGKCTRFHQSRTWRPMLSAGRRDSSWLGQLNSNIHRAIRCSVTTGCTI